MKRYPYYPIYLDIEDRSVVIIGGGNVCARKAETMMKYGARVTVVSPEFTEEIEQWAREGCLALKRKEYDASDLDGANIVIASTDVQAVNEQIAADCRARRIPVNVVDVTPLCEFIVPAIIESGSIQIAVSTGGKSPALARTLKEDLQRTIGPEYAEVNDVLGTLREGAKRVLPTDVDRKRFFDGIIAQGILPMLREGNRRGAYETIARACEAAGVPVSERVRQELS
ncbi:MAG TPA: bifunctional precorrin-2 dehydrogenase/sirohydrochlorin ferrochelatase [Thermoanaerobaculia bacterium]|nr:bifunctional precorrin-2 dehydrogenase/sirohydrochlorin ferrochelatase [Thermoanaerobaculia bacterium]